MYAIRAAEVVLSRGVVPARAVRERLGLRSEQSLVLLLFDQDGVLERIWNARTVWEIAEAGYTWVVSPSYSVWSPRPRSETLVNAKRSLKYFEALQAVGVSAIPRVAWETEHDVMRFADWALANGYLELVALDLQTYRSTDNWQLALEGLALFDQRTHERLSYLVNGATVLSRCVELCKTVDPARLCITNATSQVGLRLPNRGPSRLAAISHQGQRFTAQTRLQEGVVKMAGALSQHGGQDVADGSQRAAA